MQALALALVACMVLWSIDRRSPTDPMMRYMKRILWVLLLIYLLSPIFVFGLALLPILFL